jgi:hypothetical protein
MSHDTTMSEVRRQVTPEEWQTRVELAAAYRLVAHFGWDDLIFTHISARVPGQPGQFLINPYGMLFDEITASSLVKVDHEGQPLMETEYDVNPAGFVIHSAIHDGRPEVQCVLHTHTLRRGRVGSKGWTAAHLAAVHLPAGAPGLPRLRGRGPA